MSHTPIHPRPHTYTHGGMPGHIVRRLIHLSTFLLPLLYYHAVERSMNFYGLGPIGFVVAIMIIILALEGLRLTKGVRIFGQRRSEARRISSFTWSAIAISLVLLFAPGKQFAIPIIWSCAFGDPLLGELKCCSINKTTIAAFGVIFISVIWLGCYFWLGTPVWLVPVMGPLITAAEWPSFKWIDDNALMHLLPLALVLLFH